MNGRRVEHVVYLAPVPIGSPAQRPHHFAAWVHERLGATVSWIEPYPVRLPRWTDGRRLLPSVRRDRSKLAPHWRDAHWLEVLRVGGWPMEPLPGGARLVAWQQASARLVLRARLADPGCWLAVGRPSGLALALSTGLQGKRVLYDVMDDMTQFSDGLSRRWMRRMHLGLLARSQAVWVSSEPLMEKTRLQTEAKVTLVRNGAPPVPEPARTGDGERVGQPAHARAPLVLGYVGTLASWFDWPLLIRLARALPQVRFELVGPLDDAKPRALPANVRLRGAVPHAQVFALLRQWHGGLIPFVHNPLTACVDPIKYYEYRACGLPVLSTMFGEMPHHAAEDEGVWPLESLEVETLAPRLRAWHAALAERHAQGQPLAPDLLRQARWEARFDHGARCCGWL